VRPLVLAHRGASADAPENSLAAFRLAGEQGADGVELDVLRCASGEVVVFHDDDLERLTGRRGAVRDTTYAELAELDLGGGERIPLLSEALAACAGLLVNVELKAPSTWAARARDDGLAREVATLIAPHRERVLVSSFDPLLLHRFHRAQREVPIGLLFAHDQWLPLRRAWAEALVHPTALHPEAMLVDAPAIRAWRARGRLVNTWTVDHPAEARALAALGVDGIITNRPAVVKAVLNGE
jgi:glycerophosphoryl diester phosphodiesterase